MAGPEQQHRQAMQLVMRELLAKKGVGVSTALDILQATGTADQKAIDRTKDSFKTVEQRGTGPAHPTEVTLDDFINSVQKSFDIGAQVGLDETRSLREMVRVAHERAQKHAGVEISAATDNTITHQAEIKTDMGNGPKTEVQAPSETTSTRLDR